MMTRQIGRWFQRIAGGLKRSQRRRGRSVLTFESLDKRLCLSAFYDFHILARTDDVGSLTSIAPAVSINDSGNVAFVGSTSAGQSVYFVSSPPPVGPPSPPRIVSFANPSSDRTYGPEVQINNSNQVAAIDITSVGAQRRARIWDANTTGSFEIIAASSTPRLTPSHFDGLGNFASMTNDGRLAFAGLENPTSGNAFWEVHLSDSLVARTADATEVAEYQIPPNIFFRHMAADNDTVVIGKRAGTTTEILLDSAAGSPVTIASTGTYWAALGVRPGISDDGQIVTFYGNEASDVDGDGLTGPGIFASVETSSGRIIQRIASTADGFTSFEVDMRVGVNSTQADQRAVTIVYMGTKNNKLGIYSSRLNFFGDFVGAFAPNDPKYFTVSKPTVVIETGDVVFEDANGAGVFQVGVENALSGVVQSLSIHDPVNSRDRGDVAFWVSTGSDQGIVRARPQEVIYLDFDPVNNFAANAGFGAGIFSDIGVPADWPDNMAGAFETLDPGLTRTDLHGTANTAAIQQQIAQFVREAFSTVGINVRVLESGADPAPSNGRFTRAFIGDGPHGPLNPSGLAGQAASIDLFNQDLLDLPGPDKLFGTPDDLFSLFGIDTVLIFVDNIFRPSSGYFIDSLGPVGLDSTGPGKITLSQVVNAIGKTVVHELGHALGLLHISNTLNQYLMNQYVDPEELRNVQVFSTTLQPLAEVPAGTQNDRNRLARTIGTDANVPRDAPHPDALKLLDRSTLSIGTSVASGSLIVQKGILGIVPLGEEHIAPELIDLGSGDLATLLSGEISVREGDKIFFVGSTNGAGIDVFSLIDGFGGNVAAIDLSNALLVATDESIRGDVFSSTGQPNPKFVNLYHVTGNGPLLLGSLSPALAPNSPPVLGAIGDKAVDELATLSFTASATDTDLPANELAFSLIGAPAGATIDPNTGLFSWTPTELQGPGSYTFTVRVTDDGNPPLFDEEEITVTVNESNTSPIVRVTLPADGSIFSEGTNITFAGTADDAQDGDLTDGLAWTSSLDGTIGTGGSVSEVLSVGVHTITSSVTDSGGLSGSDVITVTVQATPLTVLQVQVNQGDVQRSNVESVAVHFSRSINFDDLVTDGQLADAVQLIGNSPIGLGLTRYQYDAVNYVLTIDLTTDGFGGSNQSILSDGLYQLRLDTSRILSSSNVDAALKDTDGVLDGFYTFDFHRLLGDLDGDRRVTLYDVMAVRNAIFGLVSNEAADLNGDGLIDSDDLLLAMSRVGRKVP